jgi:hypothetical protein
VNVTDKSRVEALQRQLTEQAQAIQPGKDWRQMLDFPARSLALHADCSIRSDTAIVAGVPDLAIGA